ncbi:MAG: hypothetical protein CSA65_03745 [Proteobacteria bacterium]|nr:MAG: hypothetical protein CSA65_03745 [Pseudomonadota bacterium]
MEEPRPKEPRPKEPRPKEAKPSADDGVEDRKSAEEGATGAVDVLDEVGWDNLLSDDAPALEAAVDVDLTPRIDVDELRKQAGISPARPADELSKQAQQRERRSTPLTLQTGMERAGFAASEATPLSLPTAEVADVGAPPADGFAMVSKAEPSADEVTPGSARSIEASGRPTTRYLTSSSNKVLEPEGVFSQVDEAELIAKDVTPASMIKRRPPRLTALQRSGPAPAPPAISIAVPPPVPRSAHTNKHLELKVEEGFVGLDDLLTGDEEQALQAASQGAPTQRRSSPSPDSPASSDGLAAEAFGSSRGTRPSRTGPAFPATDSSSSSLPASESSLSRGLRPLSGESDESFGAGSVDGSLEGLAREAESFADRDCPVPAEGEERLESMIAGARQLYDQGTFEGSLWLCQKILSIEPSEATAQEFLRLNEEVLLRQYERQLVDLSTVPVIQIPQQEIVWHKLDHRAGFLLSRVDGMLSYDDILDISGMERFEACRILAQLVEQGVIGRDR